MKHWDYTLIDEKSNWYISFPLDILEIFESIASNVRDDTSELNFKVSDFATPDPSFIEGIKRVLEDGRGFVILETIPQKYSIHQKRAIYWVLSQWIASPTPQNVQNTLIYDVKDLGVDIKNGFRYSVTNLETNFHTDNPFGAHILNYVGLLCLQKAQSGGISQMMSGYTLLKILQTEYPSALEILKKPFHYDKRAGRREDEPLTGFYPPIAWDGKDLLIRYLRYWIEVGHEKMNVPLTEEQKNALDIVDRVLLRPELRVEFLLEPGQILFNNNRWLLHNRTNFQDDPEDHKKRHLLRIWLI